MKIIAAMTENRVIGDGDKLPWHLPDEQEHYRRLIADQTVIMGRRSYELFKKDLTSRHAVVVSRSRADVPSAMVCETLDSAIEEATSLGRVVYVNGGESIYEQAIPLADGLELSIIKGDYSGDAYFPAIDEATWLLTLRQDHGAWEFRRYDRVQKKTPPR
ncbi:MAG: dihydrofolate reductase [Pirellulales bacterium]|nr:dihydrofolate reductase [Pirellulales bacterium]